MDLRKIVDDRMAELGISQQQLAERAGISRVRLNRWLGSVQPSLGSDLLEPLLEALELQVVPVRRRKAGRKT